MKFPWQKKEGDGSGTETLEINIPDDQLKKVIDDTLSAKLKDELKDVTSFISDARKEREEAENRRIAEENRKKSAENKEELDQNLQELMLTDPAKAIHLATVGQQKVILQLRADNIRKEVFEDADKFEFYTGEFKAEVDKLIKAQPVENQNDPSVVENCYFSLLGRKQKEINEGKLKSRFASPGSGGKNNGKTGAGDHTSDETLEINDDIRKAARITGVTPEEYAKMVQEAGVGYV